MNFLMSYFTWVQQYTNHPYGWAGLICLIGSGFGVTAISYYNYNHENIKTIIWASLSMIFIIFGLITFNDGVSQHGKVQDRNESKLKFLNHEKAKLCRMGV